jgi:hypothetical protein
VRKAQLLLRNSAGRPGGSVLGALWGMTLVKNIKRDNFPKAEKNHESLYQ